MLSCIDHSWLLKRKILFVKQYIQYNTIQFAALLYRWNYLKMIFDPKLWQQEAVGLLASTIASLYATILCCVYIAFAFTELVTYPLFKVRHTLVLVV